MTPKEYEAYIREIRQEIAAIRKHVSVNELREGPQKIVILTHRPTGIVVEWPFGASVSQCYEDAFLELLDEIDKRGA